MFYLHETEPRPLVIDIVGVLELESDSLAKPLIILIKLFILRS